MEYLHVDVLGLIDQPPTKLEIEYKTYPIGPSIKSRQVPIRPNILRYKIQIKNGEEKQLEFVLRIVGQKEPYASIKIPLVWFEPGTIVHEYFPMRTINKPYQTILIRLLVQRSKVKCDPFVGGRIGSLLIVPTWHRPIDCEPPRAAVLRKRKEERRAQQIHKNKIPTLQQVPVMPNPYWIPEMQPMNIVPPQFGLTAVTSPYVEPLMQNLVPNSLPTSTVGPSYPSNQNLNIYSRLISDSGAIYSHPPNIAFYPAIPI